MLVELQI